MRFPRQEYWSGLSFPCSVCLANRGMEPCLLHWQVGSLPLSHLRGPTPAQYAVIKLNYRFSLTSFSIFGWRMDIRGAWMSQNSHTGGSEVKILEIIRKKSDRQASVPINSWLEFLLSGSQSPDEQSQHHLGTH